MQVLLLEPDNWRYLGISRVLEKQPELTFLGDPDYRKILTFPSPPSHLKPHVVIVSHSLTFDYKLEVLAHLQKTFPDAQLLVDGYDETLEGIADVLRAGAKGYFQLSTDPANLVKALGIVRNGHIWAPRAVVSLLIEEGLSRPGTPLDGQVTTQELAILELLQRGSQNKEIAKKLGIVEVTVKTHLTRLYRRFGVHTRLELLTYALTHHILSGTHRRAPREIPEI